MTEEEIKILARRSYPQTMITESGFDIVAPVWLSENSTATRSAADKFIQKFFSAYDNRPSKRISGKMTTVPDKLIDNLIEVRISSFTPEDIALIRFGHRLSMGAENIIGLILEEYIHTKVLKHGWATCWGSCIKAVDLCNKKGDLIQIKNKYNTENSSSDKIREGTTIQKWFRLSSKGQAEWSTLNRMLGIPESDKLSEDDFIRFARDVVSKNPKCLSVDSDEYNAIQKILDSRK